MPVEDEVYTGCTCEGCLSMLSPAQRALAEAQREREEREERALEQRAQRLAARRERDRMRRIEEQRVVLEATMSEEVPCATCGESFVRRNMLTMDGALHCANDVAACADCRAIHRTEDMETYHSGWRDATVCTSCTSECFDCEERFRTADMIVIRGSFYCRDCVSYCDDCDNYHREDECPSCERRIRGLSSYGKTYPERWLGGPVPKDKKGLDTGYYIGFELEIYATRGHVNAIHQWAETVLGYGDALDCKEDSSVTGFEIATQPMTPEFFEKVDWESFFDVLNDKFPLDDRSGEEWLEHGLHVHIGRAAFARDDIAMAAFCYLIGQGDHLVRIGRREPTTYCKKVDKPVSTAIKQRSIETSKYTKQVSKRSYQGIYPNRDAINLMNGTTIEIRAFRSTRKADDLRDAVRLVYVAAEYIRYLRRGAGNVSPKALHWGAFSRWVGVHHPEAFNSIAGITDKKTVR